WTKDVDAQGREVWINDQGKVWKGTFSVDSEGTLTFNSHDGTSWTFTRDGETQKVSKEAAVEAEAAGRESAVEAEKTEETLHRVRGTAGFAVVFAYTQMLETIEPKDPVKVAEAAGKEAEALRGTTHEEVKIIEHLYEATYKKPLAQGLEDVFGKDAAQDILKSGAGAGPEAPTTTAGSVENTGEGAEQRTEAAVQPVEAATAMKTGEATGEGGDVQAAKEAAEQPTEADEVLTGLRKYEARDLAIGTGYYVNVYVFLEVQKSPVKLIEALEGISPEDPERRLQALAVMKELYRLAPGGELEDALRANLTGSELAKALALVNGAKITRHDGDYGETRKYPDSTVVEVDETRKGTETGGGTAEGE